METMLLVWDSKTNWQVLSIFLFFFYHRLGECGDVSSTLAQPACAQSSASPISIPIRNVTLNDGTSRRGAAISVGTPPQALAFDATGYNNTYIYDGAASCGVDTIAVCNARLGGLFDEGNSSTWDAYATYTAPGFGNVDEALKDSADSSGTDVLQLSDQLNLDKFPFAIDHAGITRDGGALNQLGLGSNSSLLRYLQTRGAINSQTWSMWQGWNGAEASQQMDGNIVLGGYDEAKFTGTNVTQPIENDSNCDTGFIISVTDIRMNLKNGSSPSIFGISYGQALRACVNPRDNNVALPSDIWGRFMEASNSTDVGPSSTKFNFNSRLVLTDGAYDGDLTFTIHPNLNIRIPNHQLVVPEYNYSINGQRYYSNATETAVLVWSLPRLFKDLPKFGKPFLSSAYLLVDNDRQRFSLWEAQPNATQNLVSLGPPVCSSTDSSAPGAPPSSAPAVSPSSPSTIPSNGAPKGEIAGVVVGGLVAIAAVICAILIAWRRRRKQGQQPQSNKTGTSGLPSGGHRSSRWGEKPEMASDQHPPLEMPLSTDPAYVLAPYEVPDRNDLRYAWETQEMPSEQFLWQAAHEVPATPMSGRPF